MTQFWEFIKPVFTVEMAFENMAMLTAFLGLILCLVILPISAKKRYIESEAKKAIKQGLLTAVCCLSGMLMLVPEYAEVLSGFHISRYWLFVPIASILTASYFSYKVR